MPPKRIRASSARGSSARASSSRTSSATPRRAARPSPAPKRAAPSRPSPAAPRRPAARPSNRGTRQVRAASKRSAPVVKVKQVCTARKRSAPACTATPPAKRVKLASKVPVSARSGKGTKTTNSFIDRESVAYIKFSHKGMAKQGNKDKKTAAAHIVSLGMVNAVMTSQPDGKKLSKSQQKKLNDVLNSGRNLRLKSEEGNRKDERRDARICKGMIEKVPIQGKSTLDRARSVLKTVKKLDYPPLKSILEKPLKNVLRRSNAKSSESNKTSGTSSNPGPAHATNIIDLTVD